MAMVGFWVLLLFAAWQFYLAWQVSQKVSPGTPLATIFPTARNRAKPEFRKMWVHYAIGCTTVLLSLFYGLALVPGFEF